MSSQRYLVYNRRMSDELTIDGEQYISSKRASELSEYEQDYIGQLCRGGNIRARRVGGLWYVSSDSLMRYKERADEYKPEPPVLNGEINKPDSLVSFDGRGHISTSRAAKITGYSPDYVGQMARAGIISSRQVGNRWYVERAGILSHKESKDALLGAVQAQSVGLRAPMTGDANEEGSDYLTDEPFFRYTSDNRELMPVLEDSHEDNDGEIEEDAHQIPIHVGRASAMPARHLLEHESGSLMPSAGSGGISEKTMYSLVLPAMVMTIVIVISLGFVSLKTSSVFTVNDSMEVGGRALTAGAAGALVERLADALEVILAPELVYIREE